MFNGLSIRRQSKNFCKNMLMGYYPGEKKNRLLCFIAILLFFIDLTLDRMGETLNGCSIR